MRNCMLYPVHYRPTAHGFVCLDDSGVGAGQRDVDDSILLRDQVFFVRKEPTYWSLSNPTSISAI